MKSFARRMDTISSDRVILDNAHVALTEFELFPET